MANSVGLVRVTTPAEVRQQQTAIPPTNEVIETPFESDLARELHSGFERARQHRQIHGLEKQMLEALRTYQGKYDPAKLSEIKTFNGSEVYSRLTSTKCRGASALLRDIYFSGERPWMLSPTPEPKIPGGIAASVHALIQTEVQTLQQGGQQVSPQMIEDRTTALLSAAKKAEKRMARKEAEKATSFLDDLLIEGGFYKALGEAIVDLPIFPYACIKGPVVRMSTDVQWQEDGSKKLVDEPKMFWDRVSPFDLYFSPGASSAARSRIWEHQKLQRSELFKLIGLPGYKEDSIRAVLDASPNSLKTWLSYFEREREDLERRDNFLFNDDDEFIDCMEFNGFLSGRKLRDWGMTEAEIPDVQGEYYTTAWLIDKWIIKVQLSVSAKQRCRYYITSFEKIPGSVTGSGLPEILGDVQDVANASLRSLVNNMCLTGDTVVYREPRPTAKSGKKQAACGEVTLQTLWRASQKHNPGTRRNVIRALDTTTGELVGRRIDQIHNNGVQDVFTVRTAGGYAIKATATHRFLADDGGWRTVKKFKVGDMIGVNGRVVALKPNCINCGVALVRRDALRCKSCAVQAPGAWNDQQAQAALTNRDVSATTARGRKLVKEQKKSHCETCGCEGPKLQIHHMDMDPWNCAPDNLRTLCEPCHKEWHVRYGRFGHPRRHRFLDFDRIVAIEYAGRKQTFCLTMQGEPNFIANGFVSHNSIASGPQVAIDDTRMAPGADADSMYPWKRWHFVSDPLNNATKPVDFFQPNSNAQELLSVYKEFTNMADEISAIPRYLTGSQRTGGAGATASGLAMLMNNASKVMQGVAANIDEDVIAPAIEDLYEMVMLTDREQLRGDEEVVVRGVTLAVQREQDRVRQLEFLGITANPIDMQIVGPKGRAKVLRHVAQNLGLAMDEEIVGDDEEMAARIQQQQDAAAQAQGADGTQSALPNPGRTENGPPRLDAVSNTSSM